jgi:hypothetical protein
LPMIPAQTVCRFRAASASQTIIELNLNMYGKIQVTK